MYPAELLKGVGFQNTRINDFSTFSSFLFVQQTLLSAKQIHIIYTFFPSPVQPLLGELMQILGDPLFLGGHLKNKAAEKAS